MFIKTELLEACKAECDMAVLTSPSHRQLTSPLFIPLQPLASLLFFKYTKLLPIWGPLYFVSMFLQFFPIVLSLTGHFMFVTHVSALTSPLVRSSTMTLSKGAAQSFYISSSWVIFIAIFSLSKMILLICQMTRAFL